LSDDIMTKARADGLNITNKQAVDSAKKRLGDQSYLRLRLQELASNEARIMGATKASGSTKAESRQDMADLASEVSDVARPVVQQMQPVVQQIQQQLPSPSQAASALRQAEINKLLGMTPTQ